MNSVPVTGEMRDVFNAIAKYISDTGYPPSLRALGKMVHMSHVTVLRRLRDLENVGWISRQQGRPRTIKVLVSGSRFTCSRCYYTIVIASDNQLPETCPYCNNEVQWALRDKK